MPDFDDDDGPPLDSGQKEAGMRLRLLRRSVSDEEEGGVVAGLAGVGVVALAVEGWWTGLLLMVWFPRARKGFWPSECRRTGGEVARGAGGRGYVGR